MIHPQNGAWHSAHKHWSLTARLHLNASIRQPGILTHKKNMGFQKAQLRPGDRPSTTPRDGVSQALSNSSRPLPAQVGPGLEQARSAQGYASAAEKVTTLSHKPSCHLSSDPQFLLPTDSVKQYSTCKGPGNWSLSLLCPLQLAQVGGGRTTPSGGKPGLLPGAGTSPCLCVPHQNEIPAPQGARGTGTLKNNH